MSHPQIHAQSSAAKWGGDPAEYLKYHEWFDQSKAHIGDFRHRALRHHTEGIFMLESLFGTTMTNSAGQVVPIRYIGEQHVLEDLGQIPTVADWFREIQPKSWMMKKIRKVMKEY